MPLSSVPCLVNSLSLLYTIVPVYPKFTWADPNTKTRAFVASYQADIAAGGIQFTLSAKTTGFIGIGVLLYLHFFI